MTDTLYDLLGALPRDDAEDLRTAFRKAVKGAHPDLNPADPDAALKFRQIVRANEILSDDEQRAAYDHLLDLACLEQQSASRSTFASRFHKFASGSLAVVGLSALTIGTYLLFMHISAASVSVSQKLEIGSGSPASAQGVAEEPATADSRSASAFNVAASGETAAGVPFCPRALDIFVDRSAILQGAFAELDRTIDPALRSAGSYMDRNIIFYRPQTSEAAFTELVPPKLNDKANHAKPVVTAPKAQREAQESRMAPLYPRRTADRDLSRQGGL